ncbi:MAG: hypothetical protein GX267_10920 [Fibrobacter sp.]|jgi:hypothetical protein|nr:hypothetical protein [Fibrobacter sp.]
MNPANSAVSNPEDPFVEFHPFLWTPQRNSSEDTIYSIKRNHGVQSSFKLHNPNDPINSSLPKYEKILVEYKINDYSYPIITISDLINSSFVYDAQAEGNILGDLAERISRRITKYFLKHWDKNGKTGGIFEPGFDVRNCRDFIVAHSSDYILKIKQYPNLIILKKTGKGKYGYENIKEIDGFFDYRYYGKRHILVLESKLERINVDCDFLIENLFNPLRILFPDARFHYILFTDKHSIFTANNYERLRQIKPFPAKIYERLSSEQIGTLFFTFNESRQDFERIKDFLMLQYKALNNEVLTIIGKTVLSEKEITVYDGGESPHIRLVKDKKSGLWHEVKIQNPL